MPVSQELPRLLSLNKVLTGEGKKIDTDCGEQMCTKSNEMFHVWEAEVRASQSQLWEAIFEKLQKNNPNECSNSTTRILVCSRNTSIC